MWYFTKAAFLLVFGCLGYAAFSLLYDLFRRKPAPDIAMAWIGNDPLPADTESDLPTRFLLRLGNEAELQDLARRVHEDSDFRRMASHRRRQLIHAYSDGSLQLELYEPFRKTLLKVSGVPQEIEVEQALRSFLDPRPPRLQVELTNPLGRPDRLWRRLTLPSPTLDAELAGGPRLMVNSAYTFGEPVNLLGSVTSVEEQTIAVNLGTKHGIGPGDFIQIERDNDRWIGTAVVESAADLESRGLFMGEDPPRSGDRVLVRLGEE